MRDALPNAFLGWVTEGTMGDVLEGHPALDELVRALDASRNPVIVAGAQIEEDEGWHDVIALAEHLSADVYQQPIPPRWTFPRTHPLFRGGLLPAEGGMRFLGGPAQHHVVRVGLHLEGHRQR